MNPQWNGKLRGAKNVDHSSRFVSEVQSHSCDWLKPGTEKGVKKEVPPPTAPWSLDPIRILPFYHVISLLPITAHRIVFRAYNAWYVFSEVFSV